MNKIIISRILSVLFLVLIFTIVIIVNMSKPRVMILHSYHTDYAWTRDVDIGLKRVTENWVNYNVTWHYMDTKKFKDKQWLDRAGIIARQAIDRTDPQILIAIDDFAQSLAAKHYINKAGIDIIFAGVNGTVDAYGYNNANNVTGIFEHKLLEPIKEIILTINEKTDKLKQPSLLYLMDPSASIKQGQKLIDHYDWGEINYIGSVVAEDFEHWQELVLQKSQEVDYIIVSNYRKLPQTQKERSFADPKKVMSWTEEHSKVPVIGINSFNVEDGAMLSVGVSPYEQGETVAKMAVTIIEKSISASQIPFQENEMYIIALRNEILKKRDIKLPSLYSAFGYLFSVFKYCPRGQCNDPPK